MSPLWLLHQQPLWQGLSTQQSCWIVSLKEVIFYIYYSSTELCEKLLHICKFFIISFILIGYVFVFQNIIIEERNVYAFTIFRESQLVFVPLKKTIIFRVFCPELLIPTANLLIIPGPLVCLECLSSMVVSIISSWSWRWSWNIIFSCCSFLTTLIWRWHQAVIKKFRNLLLPISIPIYLCHHLTGWWVKAFLII